MADLNVKENGIGKSVLSGTKKNADYFKTNYLQKKIDNATQCRGDPGKIQPEKHLIKVPASRMKTEMPLEFVKEVIGVQLVIIYEYLAQLLDRRWQKAIHAHHPSQCRADLSTIPKIIFKR